MSSEHAGPSRQVRGPSSRSKLACKQCRRRHVKCDQQKPCRSCRNLNVTCDFGEEELFNPIEWSPESGDTESSLHFSPFRLEDAPLSFQDESAQVADRYDVVGPSRQQSAAAFVNSPSAWSSTSDPAIRATAPGSFAASQPRSGSYQDASNVRAGAGFTIPSSPNAPPPLTNPTDAFYMSRYTEVIGPWFDLLDTEVGFFSSVIPVYALGDRLLLLACLAAASRQLALTATQDKRRASEQSLAYHNQAIRLLYERLNQGHHDATTFASCLLVAHCEMNESEPTDWQGHLRGAGQLVEVGEWNAASGGLIQACFWIYCRMSILAALSLGQPTPIDTNLWLPNESYFEVSSWTRQAWSNKVVYLLGCVHNFRCRTRTIENQAQLSASRAEWSSLASELSKHSMQKPLVFAPVSILPPQDENQENPFETTRYVDAQAAAIWQMFDTACLILQLAVPSTGADRYRVISAPETTDKVLSYARKVVSSTITNRNAVAWVNAVELLATTAKCLTELRERKASIGILEDINHATGWETQSVVNGLLTAWGWAGHDWKTISGEINQPDIGSLVYAMWAS